MKRLVALLAVAVASFGLSACGGTDSSTTETSATAPSPTTTASATNNLPMATTADGTELPLMDNRAEDNHIRYVANPNGGLAYAFTEVSGRAGKNTLQFVNPQNAVHNVVIEGHNGETLGETKKIKEGETSIQIVLKAGTYAAYCSLPGHRKAGMRGHLIVYPK
jgi:plastocyanin